MRLKFFFVVFTLLGTVILSSFTFLQRSNSERDLVFHQGNYHDALWHLALMGELEQAVPPANPLLEDEQLVGYHYFNDLLWVAVSKLTGISFLTLYLRVAPVVLAALFVSTTLLLFLRIFPSKITAYLGASIVIFGANLAYVVPLIFSLSLGGQSVFWLDQTVYLGINQQLLLSLSLANIFLLLFLKSYKKYGWLITVLVGALMLIKVYAAMVFVVALGAVATVDAVWRKKYRLLVITIAAVICVVPGLLLIGNKNGFPFEWQPGWFFKAMFESEDRLNYVRWEHIRLNSIAEQNIFRLVVLWSGAVVLFFVGNFSVKLLGIFLAPLIILKTKEDDEKLFWLMLCAIVVFCFAMPTFFLQKGVSWNTIQFLPYTFVPLGLLFTKVIQTILRSERWQKGVLIVSLLVVLPTTIQTVMLNMQPQSYQQVSVGMIQDIQHLDSTYLNKRLLLHTSLASYSLIPAFSSRRVYYGDLAVQSILGNALDDKNEYQNAVGRGLQECKTNEILLSATRDGRLRIQQCPFVVMY